MASKPIENLEITDSRTSSTLLSADSFGSSEDSLEKYIQKNTPVQIFLRITGVIWTSNGALISSVFQYSWNIFVRLCLIAALLFGAAEIVYTFVMHDLSMASYVVVTLASITLALQSLTLILSLIDINKRLKHTVTKHYVQNLSVGLEWSYFVLMTSLAISVIPLAVAVWLYGFDFLVWLLVQIGISLILTAIMYFITTDCAVASSLLDQLTEQRDLQLLTFEQYSRARDEVLERQDASAWINNAIVVVALLDIGTVLVGTFVDASGQDDFAWFLIVGYFVKEIPFVVAVYWQIAKVNEKSALFLKQLSKVRWSIESNRNNERLEIYVNAQGNPIEMSIAGMKLKRRDLAWQFALWCFAFLVSIVKAAVASNV